MTLFRVAFQPIFALMQINRDSYRENECQCTVIDVIFTVFYRI
jgi:hypothetical protein